MSESPDHTPLSARRGMGWVLTGYGVLNIAVALQQLVAGDTDALFALAVMGFGLTWVGQRLLKKDRLLKIVGSINQFLHILDKYLGFLHDPIYLHTLIKCHHR